MSHRLVVVKGFAQSQRGTASHPKSPNGAKGALEGIEAVGRVYVYVEEWIEE